MTLRSFLLIAAVLLSIFSFGQERKVLIIGIDGTRPDALQEANTPAVDGLIANASFTYDGLTQFPTYSGPGWSSMLTGVWSDKHGVTDNSFEGSNFGDYPHLFDLVKTANPDAFCASVCQWDPINDEISQQADIQINTPSMQQSEDAAADQLANPDLDVLFVHFDDVDIAGHTYGYAADIPQYISAIEAADGHVGNVLSAVESRPTYADEEWLVVVSTDHGGIGFGHGGSSYDERNIFLIFSGPNFPNEELETEWDTWESNPSLALNLNQTDVYGTLDHEVYEFEEGEDFTIELRIKTNGWTGDPSIISDKDWISGFNPGFILSCQTDEATWKYNLGDGADRIDLDGGAINDGEWHHIAVSMDADGETFLFQDGEVVASTNETLDGSIISGLPIALGQDGTLTYGFDFDGWIDELRIWNVALAENTLGQWACADLGVFHENYDDLIGYWKMEEIADIVIDGADPNNQIDLALVNGPYISEEDAMTCQSVLTEAPKMVDITPTALTHLCIPIQEVWDLDGTAVGISIDDCANNIAAEGLPSYLVYPNPVSEVLTIQSNSNLQAEWKSISSMGQMIDQGMIKGQAAIDVSDWSPGVYQIHITEGAQSRTVQVVVL
jgi:hypothetical protein